MPAGSSRADPWNKGQTARLRCSIAADEIN